MAMEDEAAYLLPDQGLHAFLAHCSEVIGDAYFRTPRNTIKAFLDLLAVLDQNPGTDWRALLGQSRWSPTQSRTWRGTTSSPGPVAGTALGDDALTAFRL